MRYLQRGAWLLGLMAACGGKANRETIATSTGGTNAVSPGGQAGARDVAGAPGTAGGGAGGTPPNEVEGGASDAGAAGQSASGEAGTTSWSPDSGRVLTKLASDGAWYGKDPTQGLVVAPNGHVLLETAYEIYEIAGAKVNDYLTDAEAVATVGNHDGYEFGSLGLDQQGTLYATFSGSLIRSKAAHQLELWRAEPGSAMAPALSTAVLGHDDVISVSTDGMWRVTGQTVPNQLKSFTAIDDPCPYPKLSLGASGTFLLLRGCAMNRVERGHFDGLVVSDISAWLDGTFPPSGTSDAAQFLCATTNPAGGFYLVVKQPTGTELYYLTDDATAGAGFSKITVSPSLDEASHMTGDTESLRKCNIAAASDGTVYLQSSMVLWKLAIQP